MGQAIQSLRPPKSFRNRPGPPRVARRGEREPVPQRRNRRRSRAAGPRLGPRILIFLARLGPGFQSPDFGSRLRAQSAAAGRRGSASPGMAWLLGALGLLLSALTSKHNSGTFRCGPNCTAVVEPWCADSLRVRMFAPTLTAPLDDAAGALAASSRCGPAAAAAAAAHRVLPDGIANGAIRASWADGTLRFFHSGGGPAPFLSGTFAARIFRGRVAATPRPRREYSVERPAERPQVPSLGFASGPRRPPGRRRRLRARTLARSARLGYGCRPMPRGASPMASCSTFHETSISPCGFSFDESRRRRGCDVDIP